MNTIITLSALGMITMILGVFNRKNLLIPIVLVGLLTAILFTASEWNSNVHYFNNMLVIDRFSSAFGILMIFGTFLIFLIARHYFRRFEKPMEDIYSILIFSLVGAIIITMIGNLTMLFVGIEIMSVSLYILAGSKKTSPSSNEAAMKYFLMGVFSTGILLFGIALIYGTTGTFDLAEIGMWVKLNQENIPLIFKTGILLILVALAFKVGAVPFHFWIPDVYHGAPTLITAYMATVVKIASLAAFYRLFSMSFLPLQYFWGPIIWVFAFLSILFGNLAALHQDHVKRMLAYSSIAHTGYILIGFVVFNNFTTGALFYYSTSYLLATIGAFAVLMLVREDIKKGTFEAFNGLIKENKFLSISMMVFLLSLTGIPPLAGFMAKFNIFTTAIENRFIWLTVAGIIGSAISVFYYFKMIISMLMKEGSGIKVNLSARTRVLLVLILLLIILAGLMPGLFLEIV
ncbi:MAG: NADH-quinone oxidoreductase subunit N [Bacteroidales bacterium]